ncbi:MAG TPA: TolC family protein, partial [Roseateles sp.]|nr:TolC family protein [Roseateles sp.]
ELSAQAARLRLAGQLRELAWSLTGLQAEARAAEAQQGYLRELGRDVERRVRAGELAHSDALAARGELLAAETEAMAGSQRLQAERLRWQSLTGLPAEIEPSEPAEPRADAPVDGHPALLQALQAVEAARRQLELERRNRSEAPELTLGYREDRSERGQATERSMAIGLRLPFGADMRNAPLQAAAQAALDQAEAELLRLRQELETELAVARGALLGAEQQARLQEQRAELLRQRAALLERSFRAGETALPELLLAVQATAQAEAIQARHHAALGLARARLLQASGLLP